MSSAYDSIIYRAASQYGLPPALIKAIIAQESDFNPRSYSSAGAQGLMQLMPDTWKGMGITDPYDPTQNIMGGAREFSGYMKQFKGNLSLALAAYNAGPNAVKRYGGVPPYSETRNYIPKVLGYYRQFQQAMKGNDVFAAPTTAAPASSPVAAQTTSAPATATTADPQAALALRLIRSNAKAAGIPAINFQVPQIGTTITTNSPQTAKAAATPTGQAALGTSVGNAIVKAAKQFLGIPYSWGGGSLTGPSTGIDQGANTKGFDCSGLVRYAVYKATGVQIDRVTNDQVKQGRPVAKGAMRPGDLVFFGTWSNPHHVGIYVGNGQFIEAPYTGANIRISSLAGRSDFLTARRFA